MTRKWMAVAAAMAMLAGPASAAAEPTDGPIAASVARLSDVALVASPVPAPEWGTQQSDPADNPNVPRRRSRWWRVLGGAAGGAAGFYGGALIGARLEGDCNCDDPGLKGALIGAPIGAAVGAVLGSIYFFR